MSNEISDCSSAFRPEISKPFDVSKSVAMAKHADPRSPAAALVPLGAMPGGNVTIPPEALKPTRPES